VKVLITSSFLFALAVGALASPGQGQGEKPPEKSSTTIHVATGAVVLDVVVTDKRNRLVTDLKQPDFLVYEDDVLQKIDTFQARNAAGEVPGGAQPAPGTLPSYMIFLLDFSTTLPENQNLVREGAARFVEKNLGPSDYVAVFYTGVGFRLLKEFTNSKEQLAAVFGQQDVAGSSRSQTSGARAPATADLGGTTETIGRVNASLGAAAAAADAAGLASVSRVTGGVGSMDAAVLRRTTYGVLAAVENISRAVAPLEGRKALVLFSQGFVVDGTRQEAEFQRVISVANESNVAVYTVDSGGLATISGGAGGVAGISAEAGGDRIYAHGGRSLFDTAQSVGGDTRDTALRYLAGMTGGLAFRNTNDLALGLERMNQDMKSHYLLTYQPTNQNFDGSFRKIRVELKQPGLSVRTRSGYFANPPLRALTDEESRLMTDARNGKEATLRFDVALAQFPAGPQRSHVPVTVEVPAREIQFSPSGDKLVASLLIVGLLRDQNGEIVARVGTPVNVAATPEEHKVLSKGSVSFTNTIELPPGRYSLEAFIRDQTSGKSTIRDYGLQIVPLGDKLTASSIILSSHVDPLRAGESESDLTLGRTKVLPSARRQFRNGQNLIYLFNVYNVQASGDGKTDLEVRVAVERLGAAGIKLDPYRVMQLDAEGPPHVSIGRYVALNGLAPGRYFLAAEIEDLNSKQSCRALTSFEVVP